MDERNIPLSDADLDTILPSQGYEVSTPPSPHTVFIHSLTPHSSLTSKWSWSNNIYFTSF